MKKLISLVFFLAFLSPLFADRKTSIMQYNTMTVKFIWNDSYTKGPTPGKNYASSWYNPNFKSQLWYVFVINPKNSISNNIEKAYVELTTTFENTYVLGVHVVEDGLLIKRCMTTFYSYDQAMNEFQDFVNIFEKSVSY